MPSENANKVEQSIIPTSITQPLFSTMPSENANKVEQSIQEQVNTLKMRLAACMDQHSQVRCLQNNIALLFYTLYLNNIKMCSLYSVVFILFLPVYLQNLINIVLQISPT